MHLLLALLVPADASAQLSLGARVGYAFAMGEAIAAARAAERAGARTAGFVSQADFLLATGILDEVAAAGDEGERTARASEVRRLTFPGQMGEAFKVLGLSRGLDLDPVGFALRDRRGRL